MLDHGVAFHDLPEAVRSWAANGSIEVYWVPNLGPYRKLLPTLRRFMGGDFLVATADDDVMYPPGWLNGLVTAYHLNFCVTAYRCRAMRFGRNGMLLPYHDWPFFAWSASTDSGHSRGSHIFPTGRGGILYHSSYFQDLDLLEEFRLLAPGQDDVAFKIAMLIQGVPVAVASLEADGGSAGEFSGFHNPENLYYINRQATTDLTVNDLRWNRIIDHCVTRGIGTQALSGMSIGSSPRLVEKSQMIETASGRTFDEAEMIFDEEWYVARYPDIAEAVKAGHLSSGRTHFLANGRQEGRSSYRFEADWYMQAYPLAHRDLSLGRASSPQEHYARYGRFRGYLPHAGAPRPDALAEQRPRFGGLWVDLPNAQDIVAGRHDAGLIPAIQAALLSEFIDKGFVVLRAAISADIIGRVRYDLAKAFLGCYETLRFGSSDDKSRAAPWQPSTNDAAVGALNIHWLSSASRELIFSDQVVSFLQLLFDGRPIAYASQGCLRSSGKPYGQDVMRFPTTRPRHLAAASFALETWSPGASQVCCRPGSHRLGNRPIDNGYARDTGSERGDADSTTNLASGPWSAINAASLQISPDFPEQILALDCGDVVIWHAGLWHGEKPAAFKQIMRRSIEAHYCPSDVAPLSWESAPARINEFGDRGYFTTHRG